MIYIGTDENFDELMRDVPYAVVDLYGDYCGSCVALEPVLNEASNDFAMLRFIKVNCSHNPKIRERFEITGVPTVKYFKNGRQIHESHGWCEREDLNQHIAKLLYSETE